ncbi:MAG: Gfo/Idh/MocA family oxidoreductase [Spirochaetia bacterium]|nr:Gfo/Idh/MocA family oxidoreductase [Spirochaetia bacterium]
MSKVKVGLIGTGHMGLYHVNVSTGLTEECDVIGIYDNDPARGSEISNRFGVKSYDNYEKLMDDVDAVIIAVPTVLHYEVAKAALNKKKHVLVEKPMTETVDQARELVDLAKKQNLILQVGHVERFNGAVLELGKVVEKPFLIESRRLAPFSPRISDVGVVLDLMIHDLDIIINLVGSKIKSVCAHGQRVFSKHEDVAVANLIFENGTVATLTSSRVTQSKIRRLNISQEKAYIVLDFNAQDIDIHRQASSASHMTKEEMRYKQESFVEKIYIHKDNPLKQEHQHFFKCIKGEQKPIVANEDDIHTLQYAHTILKQIHEQI